MKQDSEALMEEIHENVRRDRKMLEELCSFLLKIRDVDPVSALEAVEQIARISDSLSKANSQLVELTKIKVKKETDVEVNHNVNSRLSDEEAEGLFDEIGDSATTHEDGNN